MKISLCMICGNEASVIERCLASASGAFDELCLVRAIGNQIPDATVELASAWCSRNGKPFRWLEYLNATADLPHVDNFAAARNLSFSLASGDWQLWLDCDDTLDEINCRRIREAAQHLEYVAYFCTYDVERNGAQIERERLIRRGHGHWKNAIHEVCVIAGGESAHCPQIVVRHSDHRAKHRTSAARNATILQAVLDEAPRHYFYLQAELKMLGKKTESRQAAHAALALLDPNKLEERYLVLLNLAELDPDRTEEHLLSAARIQPHRREAFAYLAQKALLDGRVSDAVSWFRVMDSLPLPSPLPWTHQGIWYAGQWARNYLRIRILRASGLHEQADLEHTTHLANPDYAAAVADHEAPPIDSAPSMT